MVFIVHYLTSPSTHTETALHLFRVKHLQIYKSSTSIQLIYPQSSLIIPASEKKVWFHFFSESLLVKPKSLPLFLSRLPILPAISHSWRRTISESDHWRTFRAKSTENICIIYLPYQGSNPCPLHWQVDSYPLYHQGSPEETFFFK